eukprot:6826726-Prymnesium_polylepis.1
MAINLLRYIDEVTFRWPAPLFFHQNYHTILVSRKQCVSIAGTHGVDAMPATLSAFCERLLEELGEEKLGEPRRPKSAQTSGNQGRPR